MFFHASPCVDVDTFELGVHPHSRGSASEVASKEIAFLCIVDQSHSIASRFKSGEEVLDVHGVLFFVTMEQWYSHRHFGGFILELLLLVECVGHLEFVLLIDSNLSFEQSKNKFLLR